MPEFQRLYSTFLVISYGYSGLKILFLAEDKFIFGWVLISRLPSREAHWKPVSGER